MSLKYITFGMFAAAAYATFAPALAYIGF